MNRAYLTALWGWIDLHRPTKRDLFVALIGFDIWGLAMVVAIVLTIGLSGPKPASHQGVQQAAASGGSGMNLQFLGVLLFAAIYEELLFRNGIQKVLHSRVRPAVAIAATALFFTGLHYWSYTGASLSATALSLSLILVGALVLGAAYWRTKNIVTPILIHGAINTLGWLGTWA